MLVVMAYSVTYLGVLSPDRVIKHDLLHYLLRGPVVGTIVIVVMLVIPRVELILGLPRETALIFAVVGVIVMGQLAVNLAKPWIDRLLYPGRPGGNRLDSDARPAPADLAATCASF